LVEERRAEKELTDVCDVDDYVYVCGVCYVLVDV